MTMRWFPRNHPVENLLAAVLLLSLLFVAREHAAPVSGPDTPIIAANTAH
jgi:hypothetical protein